MVKLEKVSVSQVAAELDKPFSMVKVTTVGDILVNVYACQGALAWHRHLDNDELFWVHEGTISLESEWGDVRLRPGELAVVPKGVGHRSSSGLRANVLLLRCGFASERKNGRSRLYGVTGESKLGRVSLVEAARAISAPLAFRTVARVEDSVVQVAWGEGTWPMEIPAFHAVMFFVLDGTATARTSSSMVHLHPGDLTVVPRGAVYQLSTTRDTVLARVTREAVRRKA